MWSAVAAALVGAVMAQESQRRAQQGLPPRQIQERPEPLETYPVTDFFAPIIGTLILISPLLLGAWIWFTFFGN